MMEQNIRVLVIGNAGVGKTTLIDVLCGEYDDIDRQTTRSRLTSGRENATIGCYINVREHQIKRTRHNSNTNISTNTNTTLLDNVSSHRRHRNEETTNSSSNNSSGIEFIEVGGSRQYELSRSVLYDRIHAVLLVHDVTNVKTMYALADWLKELTITDHKKIRFGGISARHQLGDGDGSGGGNGRGMDIDQEDGNVKRLSTRDLSAAQISMLQRIPMLIIGNKFDCISSKNKNKMITPHFAKEVQSIVYVNGAPVLSMGKACVVDTYGAAEEAVSYRNESSRMDSVLRFLDNVISQGVGFETA